MIPTNHRQAERRLVALVREGRWKVDTEGRVWRLKQTNAVRAEKWLPSGYGMVRAMIGGTRIVGLAHRLVWQVERGNIPDGLIINHRNGIKSDNRLCNLEVVTYSDNARHARRVLGVCPQHGQYNPMAKLTPRTVAEIRASRARGERVMDIASRFGVAFQTVYKVCSGERWGHLAAPAELRIREWPEVRA